MTRFTCVVILLCAPTHTRTVLAAPASLDDALKRVAAPPEFEVTLFAAPPDVSYPTCLSTSPNGDLYVGIDENGSLDAKPGRGRVVRCTDIDGDGKADQFVTFAQMDSPRGIWFDHDTLYVMHPPLLEAFIDDNGDGVVDRSEVLVKGLGFDLKFRGADHTVNGMRMGIDGFLYIAHGDYGSTNAVGKDGTTIQLHGGGVVRVRPDGTGLEIVSRGQRNIYDVAVSPELDLFTRDNTNDGGGWDVRLSHVIFGGNYGYPTLFKNFPDEIIQPLADYGGGSPCGALFMDEPGFPKEFGTALYTVEWGRNGILRHPLTPNGASWKVGQEKFIDISRPTDMDVDGAGHLYVSSWHGATFTYAGTNAGFVIRVDHKSHQAPTSPDLKKSSDKHLLQRLASPSAFWRLYTQREILRRGAKPVFASGLEKLASQNASSAVRVAAVFTLKQLLDAKSRDALLRLARKDNVREFALRALADDLKDAVAAPTQPFVRALADANPRVRLQAVIGLGRLGKVDVASRLLPLVAETDPVIAHAAVNALVSLRASEVCLQVLDSAGTANLVPGAMRVLQSLHEPSVVDGLVARLGVPASAVRASEVSNGAVVSSRLPDRAGTPKDDATRRAILRALCRLYNREDDWNGRWWGTRPDTTGPYFKPVKWSESEKIAGVLRDALAKANAEALRFLVVELQRNRVDLPELTAIVIKLANEDAVFRPVAVELFSGRPTIPDEMISLFGSVAASEKEDPALRAKAIRTLQRNSAKPEALEAAVAALTVHNKLSDEVNSAWQDFVREPRHSRNVAYFTKLTEAESPEKRTLAYGVMASLPSQRFSSSDAKEIAARAVEQAWLRPANSVPLLRAIARLRLTGYELQVRGLASDKHTDVAQAAKQAAEALGLNKSAGPADQPVIETLNFEDVVSIATKEKGDERRGALLFIKQSCVACHTVSSDEAPKGPFLGGIATRYSRAELCESILQPGAKIAQGFETQWFQMKNDDEFEGFVTREGGDDLDLRNIAGVTTTLAKKDIMERGKRDTSVMPTGLVDKLPPEDLAALLAYLESLNSK